MIEDGTSDDVVEIDAASNNGVDEIRALLDKCCYLPIHGKKRVYILDEVHMLSASAFNALLKMLEEPPEHMVFILATTEPRKVPMTISSRCQKFAFCPVKDEELASMLKKICENEGFKYEDEALMRIAKICNGSVRDAISLLDQCSSNGEVITIKVVTDLSGEPEQEDIRRTMSAIKTGNVGVAIDTIKDMWYNGKDLRAIADSMYSVLLNEVISGVGSTDQLKIMGELMMQLTRQKTQLMLLFEAAVVRMCIGLQTVEVTAPITQSEDKEPVDPKEFMVLQYRCSPYKLTMVI